MVATALDCPICERFLWKVGGSVDGVRVCSSCVAELTGRNTRFQTEKVLPPPEPDPVEDIVLEITDALDSAMSLAASSVLNRFEKKLRAAISSSKE